MRRKAARREGLVKTAVLVGLRMINKKKRQIRSRRWWHAFRPKREGAGITYSQTTMIQILRTSKAMTNSEEEQKNQEDEDEFM